MTFEHNVIHEGTIYKAGEEVPTAGTSLEQQEDKSKTSKK